MSQVTVYIGQKPYHLACDEGQEQHVTALANYFNGKVKEMARMVGPAQDSMLFLMASLTMADQMTEYEREIESLTRQVEQYSKEANLRKVSKRAGEANIRDVLASVTERLEKACSQLQKETESA